MMPRYNVGQYQICILELMVEEQSPYQAVGLVGIPPRIGVIARSTADIALKIRLLFAAVMEPGDKSRRTRPPEWLGKLSCELGHTLAVVGIGLYVPLVVFAQVGNNGVVGLCHRGGRFVGKFTKIFRKSLQSRT